jgi:hypothetical protein
MNALISDLIYDRTGAVMQAASDLWSVQHALTVLRPSPFVTPTDEQIRAYAVAKELERRARQKLLLERLRLKWRKPK